MPRNMRMHMDMSHKRFIPCSQDISVYTRHHPAGNWEGDVGQGKVREHLMYKNRVLKMEIVGNLNDVKVIIPIVLHAKP
eukprot:958111-Amphidinium_carterae.1